MDAGTDNGFSFTSPNWPTEPQEVIRHLTSNFPDHPASAFFYPGVQKLPTMASFHFIKVSAILSVTKKCIYTSFGIKHKILFGHR